MQWQFGPFRLDLDNACLWWGEQRVSVRPKPFDLLVYLVEHAGALVTKEALLDAVWPDTAVAEGVLATSLVELRKALGDTAREPQFIATVHRRGYRFIAPVLAADPLGSETPPPGAIEVSSPASADILPSPALSPSEPVAPTGRRLAAIVSADVQGYSRLMGEDEVATLETLTTYRALMAARIAQHRGRVVNAPGGNLLAEFASVVDAVECAMAIQGELAVRNRALPAHRQMWFRMGINLGDVLVEGDQLYGDGVNIAARLEGLAEGGGLCVSGTAFDQIETKLDLTYTNLGEHRVKNIVKPVRVYRVQPAAAPSEVFAPRTSPLAWEPAEPWAAQPPPYLVSRQAELAELHACWGQALQGERQVVFITGEAGIGKTTLVDAFVSEMATPSVPWVGRGQCIEQYGAGEAYLPLLEAFGALGRGPEGSHLLAWLTQQAPSWLLQMPALLSPAEYDTLQRRVVGATRERMLRELAEAVETLSTERPLVLVLEDLHWSDVSTLEWVTYVARRRQPARLLVLGTYRPSDAIVREHPVRRMTQELLVRGQCHQVVVGYLSAVQVEVYLRLRLGPGPLGAPIGPLLHQRTNGNALFLVTMVDEMVRQGVLHTGPDGWEVAEGVDVMTLAAPESVRHLLTQQLEQLSPDDQALLEAASVMGKVFTVVPVAATLGRSPEEVEEGCAALARRGQWLQAKGPESWPDGTVTARFAFLHDLYRETAYGQVPMSRRARWHEQIGLRLERGYRAQAREMAAELAEHFVHGQDAWRAVQYLQYAGENALRQSAHQEAISHLTQGLQRLESLAITPEQTQQEITLNLHLAIALVAIKGQASSEVENTYTQAWVLCEQTGETSRLIPTLLGLFRCYLARAEFERARELAEPLMRLACTESDTALCVEAHRSLGGIFFFVGQLIIARTHLEQGIALYTPQQPHSHALLYTHDPGVACLTVLAMTLWLLGYPDQSLMRSQERLTLAQTVPDPHTFAFAISTAAMVHQFRREMPLTRERAEAAVALSADQGFVFYGAMGQILLGWQRGLQGETKAGIAQIRQGLVAYRGTEAQYFYPYFFCLLAEVYGQTGQPTTGLEVLDEAIGRVDKTGERFYEAELYRLKGELLLACRADCRAEALACFHQALDVSRQQQAKSLELRAAMSLARLWQQAGKQKEAHALLAPVYSWFTEGFDTVDLKEAKTLLEDLEE